MRDREEGRPYRLFILLAVLVLALASFAAACGGDDDDEEAGETAATDTAATTEGGGEGGTIRIGIFSNNEGGFAPFEGQTWGGAMLPLIERGATAKSGDPTEGVDGATIAGKTIEIVYGGSDSTPDKAVEEARRLVEQENVDILVGPLSGSEGIAVANYSKGQPGVTFVNGISGAQDTTLKVQSPNFFRFHNDGTQWTAGLGDYAYNELGWRNVVTIGDDYDFPYSQIAASWPSSAPSAARSRSGSGRRWARRTTRPSSRRSRRTSTASSWASAAPARSPSSTSTRSCAATCPRGSWAASS